MTTSHGAADEPSDRPRREQPAHGAESRSSGIVAVRGVAPIDGAVVMTNTNDAEWMTVAEVGAALGAHPNTVRRWIRRGLLAAELRPGRHNAPTYWIRRADVRAFAELHYLGKPRPPWLDEPDG